MDHNVWMGKVRNCQTFTDITLVWTGNTLLISFLVLESDEKAYYVGPFNQMPQCLRIFSIFGGGGGGGGPKIIFTKTYSKKLVCSRYQIMIAAVDL